jgi:hypothetical protein
MSVRAGAFGAAQSESGRESDMRSIKLAVCIAAMTAGIGVAAVSANATEVASLSSCLEKADQVKSALANNTQAAAYEAAKKEQGYGRDFCTNSYYAQGVAHYARALQLLGIGEKS